MKKINSIILSTILAASSVAFGMKRSTPWPGGNSMEQKIKPQISNDQFNFAGLPPEIQLKILTDADASDSLQEHCKQIGTYRQVCQYFNELLSNENVGFGYRSSGLEHSPGMKLFLLAEALRHENNNLVKMATLFGYPNFAKFGCPDFADILAMTNPALPDHLNPECAQLIYQTQINTPSVDEEIVLHAITGNEKTLFELLDKESYDGINPILEFRSGKVNALTSAIVMSSKHGHVDLARKLFAYAQDQKKPIYLGTCLLGIAAGGNSELFKETINHYQQDIPDGDLACYMTECVLAAASHKKPGLLLDILNTANDTLEGQERGPVQQLGSNLAAYAAVGGCEICVNTATNYLQEKNLPVNEASVIMADAICAAANGDILHLNEYLNNLSNSELLPFEPQPLIIATCNHPSDVSIQVIETLLKWYNMLDETVQEILPFDAAFLVVLAMSEAVSIGNAGLVKYLVKYAQENNINSSYFVKSAQNATLCAITFEHLELAKHLIENAPVLHNIADIAEPFIMAIEDIIKSAFLDSQTEMVEFMINYARDHEIEIDWEKAIQTMHYLPYAVTLLKKYRDK